MSNPSFRAICTAVASATLLLYTLPAVADYSRVTFTATVIGVEADTGGGTFSGVGVGATVTGEFRYGLSETEATTITRETYDTEFLFTGGNYGASLTSGASNFASDIVWLDIENNYPIDAEEAADVNQAFGLNISPGDPVDIWAQLAESPGIVWDDVADCLVNGLEFEIVLADADGTMYDDLSFRAQPPAPGEIELPAFYIEQAIGTTGCNTVYAAYGTITDIQYELVTDPVPNPGSQNNGMPWLPFLLEQKGP